MTWEIKFTEFASKQISKLNKSIAKALIDYLKNKVLSNGNPRLFGKSLRDDKAGLWRYRVGDYRLICQIQDAELVILVIRLGHRKDIYED